MNIYEDYATIKLQIAKLTDELKEIEPKILEEIKTLSAPMRTNLGVFTTMTRITYKFSEDLEKKEKEYKQIVKDIQTKEIENGVATKEETVGIRFTANKQ